MTGVCLLRSVSNAGDVCIESELLFTGVQPGVKRCLLPAYLSDDIHDFQPTTMLRSSTAHLLQRPLVLTSVASCAFTVAAPTVWNSLSINTRCADSFASFKRRFKTELFASTYTT